MSMGRLIHVEQGVYQISTFLGIESSRGLEEAAYKGVRYSYTYHMHMLLTTHASLICPNSFKQNTPISEFTGTAVKPQIGLCPILRAGLGMTDSMLDLFPWVHRPRQSTWANRLS